MHAELRVVCNFGCRALCNLPWRASVSSQQVQCNIPTFEALLRKYTYPVAARGEIGREGCEISYLVEHMGLSPWLFL